MTVPHISIKLGCYSGNTIATCKSNQMGVSKNCGIPKLMDAENNGKPYKNKMDDLGGKKPAPIFGSTPK